MRDMWYGEHLNVMVEFDSPGKPFVYRSEARRHAGIDARSRLAAPGFR